MKKLTQIEIQVLANKICKDLGKRRNEVVAASNFSITEEEAECLKQILMKKEHSSTCIKNYKSRIETLRDLIKNQNTKQDNLDNKLRIATTALNQKYNKKNWGIPITDSTTVKNTINTYLISSQLPVISLQQITEDIIYQNIQEVEDIIGTLMDKYKHLFDNENHD